MSDVRKVSIRRCPYGAVFVEGREERMVISRRRVMREVGRLLDAAGKGEVEIVVRPKTAVGVS